MDLWFGHVWPLQESNGKPKTEKFEDLSSLLGALRNLLTTSYTEWLNMAQQTQGVKSLDPRATAPPVIAHPQFGIWESKFKRGTKIATKPQSISQ